MKHFPGLGLGAALLLTCAGMQAAELPEGMAPQPQQTMATGVSGTWNTDWRGVAGRTYLMEWSIDLVNWSCLPLTESGLGTKSYGGLSSTDKLFIRLAATDETPDLATATSWEPPLLRIGGEWTVVTKRKDGTDAGGVRLSIYSWPATAAVPLTTPLLTAVTATDGTYTFDHSALGADDRVEVRITGSPNQRVYLPWKDGSEAGDATIAAGGNGLTLAGYLASTGTGQTPDYTLLPGGSQTPPSSPVYRLEDFLTLDGNHHHIFPLGGHQVGDTNLSATPPQTVKRDTPTDATNWNTPFNLGWAVCFDDQTLISDNTYQAQMSVAFGNPALQISVRRNLFIVGIPQGGGVTADTVTLANQNQDIMLMDGVVADLGPVTLPYLPADYSDEQEAYMRKLVLGPVPMYVPKSVMGGKPFYYAQIADVRLHAELPLGCRLQSRFPGPSPAADRLVTNQIKWTATVSNPNDCDVQITDDAAQTGIYGPPQCLISKSNPHVFLTFTSKLPQNTAFQENFTVTVTAIARVATTEHPPGEGQTEYTYDYTETDLGSFTTELNYCGADTYPPTLAKRQAAELRGLTGNTPEGNDLNGGQRSKTLEPERCIGVNGLPAPGAPTFVDALTGRFHHSEADFTLPVPGSDLSLSVERNATDSIWTNAFGLLTTEDPLLAFGPGWDTNLSASLVRVRSLMPDGSEVAAEVDNSRLLKSSITVRDFHGRAYSFLEYTDGGGNTSYIPDPTMLPERGTAGISLSVDTTGNILTLTQPLLGLTHVFAKTSVDFHIPNNRDTPTVDGANASGFSGYQYHRLTSVTDRFGVALNYTYGSNTANIIPEVISVAGRTGLQLRIQQSGGKIQAFWDPSGIKHTYTYANRSHTPLGGGTATSFDVLATHQVGSLTAAAYGYQYAIEADPRPSAMLLPTTASAAYGIPTYHIAPCSIANGKSETLAIHYQLSQVRSSYSNAAETYFHPAGDPMLVQSIDLPNTKSVAFNLQHTLKNGWPVTPEATGSILTIVTGVTDMWGNHWTYTYDTPVSYPWTLPEEDAPFLPTASALFFPKLTRSCTEVAHSSVEYTYDVSAGFELSQTEDAANRTSSATHTEPFTQPASPYVAPLVATDTLIHAYCVMPSTTTDVLTHTTTYHFVSGGPNPLKELLPDTITDARNRVIALDRDTLARTSSVKLWSATNALLSEVDFAYASTVAPGAVTKTTRVAIGGAGDASWVRDLVKDIQLDGYGFPFRIGNDTAAIHTTITRSAAGRVLSVQSPNGGARSNVYDSSGLLQATWLEDGSNLTYQRDPAGRTVLTRDALGHATGVEYDSMGRVITAVRDMNGNLSYSTTSGLGGIDDSTDIISRADYQDTTHEVRLTDPRGNVSVRALDALGHATKIIAPANERTPGTVPTDTADYVTTIEYDLSESPTQPVKVTDPLGYETVFKFDEFARLETILRQYGTNEAENILYSGTVYGFDADSGLPDSITTIRTPLDSEGQPIGSETVSQLTNRIIYDLLDRPQTSKVAEGTDKEIQTLTTYTSTGIRYKDETRDALAGEGTSAHWSAREITCDALGRPVSEILPAVTDALTNELHQPTTNIFYDSDGRIGEISDAYGNATAFGYDVLGNLAYKKSPSVGDAKSGQPQTPITTYRYDAVGQLVRVVDPLGYAWNYEHDAAGRLTKATGPVVSPAADATHRRPVWEYVHDAAGNLTQSTDPEGHGTTRTYYPNNLTATITTPVTFTDDENASSLVDVVELYQRDAMGRITRVIDGNSQATAFTHDGLGRTLTTTRDPDDTARAKTETTTYDALLPTATVDAKDQRKEFVYNAQFHLEQLNVIASTGESLTYLYDLLGRVTHIDPTTTPADYSMGNPSIARSYDVLGHLKTETSNGVTSTYGYDLLGRLSKITNDANARVQFIQHDTAGRASILTDTNGATLTTTFGYDLAGNQVIESMSNGLGQVTDHDPIGRVTGRRIRNTNGDVLSRTDYQYDLLSNVTQIKESTAALNVPDRVIDNTYNERSQLLTETQAETGGALGTDIRTRSEVHRYDLAENRISSTSATHDPLASTPDSTLTRLFEYGNATNGKNSNQLHQLSETSDGVNFFTTSYAFDANGNRSTRTIGSAVDSYSYDAFNRLTQLGLNSSSSAENGTYNYTYDPLTRRVATASSISSSGPHLFAFSGSTPVHEWDTAINNGSLVNNIGGGVGGRLYSQDSIGNVAYPFHNARGDVVAQFSTGGTMTWHATYAASGLLQDLAGTRVGNYGANGKWEDVNGLINDGFRYRDRLTNTFLTRDPAGFIDGPNDYNYVRHNPWSAWDPNGLATILVPADTGAIGYVATTTPNNAPSVPLSGFDNPPLTVGSSSSMDMPRTGSVSPLDAALFGHSDWFPHPYGIPAWLIDPPNKIPISLSNPYGSSATGRVGEFGMDLWNGVAGYTWRGMAGDVGMTIGGAAEIIDYPFKISGTDPMALGPLGGAEMGMVEGMASLGVLLRGVAYADDLAIAANNTTRVGRWMSEAEYSSMVETEMVQAPFNGSNVSYVTVPPNSSGFIPKPPSTVFAEFDVPSSQLRIHDPGNGWGRIFGPDSLEARLAASKGLPVPSAMPPTTNIRVTTP